MEGFVVRLNAYWLCSCVLVIACGGGGATRDPHPSVGNPMGGSGGKGESGSGDGGKGQSGADVAGNGGSGTGGDGTGGNGTAGGGTGGSGTGGSDGGANATDSGTPPDTGSNAVTPGKICERLAEVLCASEAKCCDNPGRELSACKTAQMATCTGDFMADAIASQAVAGFDAAQAKTVFDEIQKRATECDTTIAEYSESRAGLRSMFKGTIASGANCMPRNATDKAMAGGALASCKDGDNFACLPSALAWTCSKHGDAGTRCFTDVNCIPGLYCDNPQLDIKGDVCQARKADGESCSQLNQCKSLYCKSSKCVPAEQQTVYCLED